VVKACALGFVVFLPSQLQILEQAAGHLRWKVGYPPSQPVGSGFEPHWRLTTGLAALIWRTALKP